MVKAFSIHSGVLPCMQPIIRRKSRNDRNSLIDIILRPRCAVRFFTAVHQLVRLFSAAATESRQGLYGYGSLAYISPQCVET